MQTLSAAFVYSLPFGDGKRYLNRNRALSHIVGGWQVSPVIRYSSGTPLFVRSGSCEVVGQFGQGCLVGVFTCSLTLALLTMRVLDVPFESALQLSSSDFNQTLEKVNHLIAVGRPPDAPRGSGSRAPVPVSRPRDDRRISHAQQGFGSGAHLSKGHSSV